MENPVFTSLHHLLHSRCVSLTSRGVFCTVVQQRTFHFSRRLYDPPSGDRGPFSGEDKSPSPQAPQIPGLSRSPPPPEATQGTGGDDDERGGGRPRGGGGGGGMQGGGSREEERKRTGAGELNIGQHIPKGFERYYQKAFLARFPNYSITSQTTALVNKKLGPEVCKYFEPLVVEIKPSSKGSAIDPAVLAKAIPQNWWRTPIRPRANTATGYDISSETAGRINQEDHGDERNNTVESETEAEQHSLDRVDKSLNETTIIMRSVGASAFKDIELATTTTDLENYILRVIARKELYIRRMRRVWFILAGLCTFVIYQAYKRQSMLSSNVDFESLTKIVMSTRAHMARFFDENNKLKLIQYFIDSRTFYEEMYNQGKEVYVSISTYFPVVPILLLLLLPIMAAMNTAFNASARMVARQASATSEGRAGAVTSSRFRFQKAIGVSARLADVAGLTEAKHEVTEVIDFMKNPNRYRALGARLPKGILLEGPPGTGKTLLAKAVAGEAMVNFVSCSGSEFEEIYVGVGAQRVRELFKQARAARPCVCFIDEIDGFGRKRQVDRGGNSRGTLNAFLSELDGFADSSGIIVIAATNRADILDPALTRSGRFDRKISIDLPPHKDRFAIALTHLRPLRLDPGTSREAFAEALASLTPGCSAADIANICNEAAIRASRRDLEYVTMDCFSKVIDRVLIGLEQHSIILKPFERQRLAYHEAGKAVLAWFLPMVDPVVKVSISPQGGRPSFSKKIAADTYIKVQERLRQGMVARLGGYASEEHFFKDLSSSAAEDLRAVTDAARQEILTYGMDPVRIGHFGYQVGEDALQKPYGPAKEDAIDLAVADIVADCAQRAREMLKTYVEKVHIIANTLIRQETIEARELWLLLGNRAEMTPELKKYLEC